jgi:dolichol-phosphate mannosyltransferase
MISIILPTYNESGNLPKLVPLIDEALIGIKYQIIVIDDNSPDGTSKVAASLAEDGYPVQVITRYKQKGLASATVRGIKEAKYPIVGVMDSDLQHNPKYLPQMISKINEGADMVIGSRYIKGSAFDNWPLHRKLISKTGLLLTKPLTGVNDPLGQFYLVKRTALEGIKFSKIGLRLSMEILVKAKLNRVEEVPITFGQRYAGESKISIGAAWQDLLNVIRLYFYKIRKNSFAKALYSLIAVV